MKSICITNNRVASFELHVKKLGGAQGFVHLFGPGVLLVEHKWRGTNLDAAPGKAINYLQKLPKRDLPQQVVVCDFARFRVRRLATGETAKFELQHLHEQVKLFGLLAGYKVQDIRSQDPVIIKAALTLGRLHEALKASGDPSHALECCWCASCMRFASADAFFCNQESIIGMVADVGTLQRLPKHEAAVAAARQAAKEIASKPPVAIWGTKQVLHYARVHSTEDSLRHMGWLQGAIWNNANVRQAISAFQHTTPDSPLAADVHQTHTR